MSGDHDNPDTVADEPVDELETTETGSASSPDDGGPRPRAKDIFNPPQEDDAVPAEPPADTVPPSEGTDAGPLVQDDEDDEPDNLLFMDGAREDDTPDEVLMSRLESLIFVSPEPATVRRLAKHLAVTGKRVRDLLTRLQADYADRGINLSEISGGFVFHTNPENAPVLRALSKAKPLKMSRPALETLAIVAYKQPCTRADVEDVRRVDCGGTLKFLFEHELIRVLGRKEEPGRPIIYGTSAKFLELFNLKGLEDLPSLREYTELWDEHRELLDEVTGDEPEQAELPRMGHPDDPGTEDFAPHAGAAADDATPDPAAQDATGDIDDQTSREH